MDGSTFSDRLKEAMAIKAMRQEELAAKAGISRQTLSSYLHGRSLPRNGTIHNLADAVDVDAARLSGFRSDWISNHQDVAVGDYIGFSETAVCNLHEIAVQYPDYVREDEYKETSSLRGMRRRANTLSKLVELPDILFDVLDLVSKAFYFYYRAKLPQSALVNGKIAEIMEDKNEQEIHHLDENGYCVMSYLEAGDLAAAQAGKALTDALMNYGNIVSGRNARRQLESGGK